MIRNYFKTAIRNFLRNKGFSLINLAGLVLGVTTCLLIGLFVWDEKQYDRFIPEGEKIYRLYDVETMTEETSNIASTPPMFATVLQQEFPEVEQTLRILQIPMKGLFERNDKKIYEEKGILTDPSFGQLFPLPLKYGSWSKALDDPESIIISEELSAKFFGNENPVGKDLIRNQQPFRVKAVFKNDLSKFHLSLNYIMPLALAGVPEERMQSWNWQQFFTYVKLKKDADAGSLQTKFQKLIIQRAQPVTRQTGFTYLPFLQPLRDIHLYAANFKLDMAVKGNINYVKALIMVAIFILLIACLNFINLATAKSLKRAKEIGVRKSVGAVRMDLIRQFMGETIFLAIVSVVVSVILAMILLPSLNSFTGKEIDANLFFMPGMIGGLVLLTLLVGLIAGFYPALILSAFKPVSVLKGVFIENSAGRNQWLRKGLVVVQFTLSGLLIISVLIVNRQVNYLHNKDLGFNKEQILFFPLQYGKMQANYESFKNELLQSSGVSSVSVGYGFPGDLVAGDDIILPQNGVMKRVPVTQLLVDHDYIKTLGLQMVTGRAFSREIRTDKDEAFIINETAVKELGFNTPEKAIGQPLYWNVWYGSNSDSLKKGKVIGVVKDFNYKSLYDKVAPAVLQIFPGAYSKVAVKISTANISGSIAAITQVWNRYSPDYPIDYRFLDESFGEMYKTEDKLKDLLFGFTAIAIFVACLGLFGLAAYAAERRTKEIGIRKVLGANVTGLITLLSRDFMKPVVLALLIASPIAWLLMNKWLQDFAYRIHIDWTIFIVAIAMALLIAILTVSIQAIKAALANPVRTLRSE